MKKATSPSVNNSSGVNKITLVKVDVQYVLCTEPCRDI